MRKVYPELVHLGKNYSEEDIRHAMANSRSNAEAARFLKVNIRTYKKYAKKYIDPLTNKTLWELHMNIRAVGIPKKFAGYKIHKDLDSMLVSDQNYSIKRLAILKDALMKDGRLGFCCSACGFSQKRLTDMKAPLILRFKDGDKANWIQENLEWVCYNCAFILGMDYFKNPAVKMVEQHSYQTEEEKDLISKFFDLDPVYLEHLEKLGLDDSGDLLFPKPKSEETLDPGEEFIDFE